MKRILLTGAAGIVGSALRPFLAARHNEVVLLDIAAISDCAANERFVQGNIADPSIVANIMSGVDGVVHLAGLVGPGYTFDEVLFPNIVGTHNVLEAACQSGVSHFIYASSHHVVGFYQRSDRIDHTTSPRPDSQYGLSKAFGESVSSYYADSFGIHVLAIRIGYVGRQVIDERRLHTWVSARDLAQLVDIGLRNAEPGYQVVYGVSETVDPFFDNSNATRLGYIPQDRAVEHLASKDLLRQQPDSDSLEGKYIGGHFAVRHFETREP